MSESGAFHVNYGYSQTVNRTEPEDKKEVLAAVYARTSSPNQRFGYSLDEQIELCNERCKLMGWTVRYIYREEGISGKNVDRPKFQVMLEKAMLGVFDVIVFWKLDRFCRSLSDLVNVEKRLDEWGIGLHSITEQIDTTTPVGRFNFRNLASAAELERELISERSRMGMYALAKKHKWPNPTPPLGYDKMDDGRLKINEVEAKTVASVFEMYMELKSMPQIAFILNKDGTETKRGAPWTAATVKKVLDNPIYAGIYSIAGVEEYVGEYQIIDDGLYTGVRIMRERFKKRRMPMDRKLATIDKIFGDYLNHLEKDAGGEPEFRFL